MTESSPGKAAQQRAHFEERYADFIPYYRDHFNPQLTDQNTPEDQLRVGRAKAVVEDVQLTDPRLHDILRRLVSSLDQRLTGIQDKESQDQQAAIRQTLQDLWWQNEFLEGMALDVMWTSVAEDFVEESQLKAGYNAQGQWIVRDVIPEPDPIWVEAAAGPEKIDDDQVLEIQRRTAALLEALPQRRRNKYLKSPEKYLSRYDPIG